MFLIDNNLSVKLPYWLKEDFPGMAHVDEYDLYESSDRDIWEFAHSHELNILTKDKDFKYLEQVLGFPPKVV